LRKLINAASPYNEFGEQDVLNDIMQTVGCKLGTDSAIIKRLSGHLISLLDDANEINYKRLFVNDDYKSIDWDKLHEFANTTGNMRDKLKASINFTLDHESALLPIQPSQAEVITEEIIPVNAIKFTPNSKTEISAQLRNLTKLYETVYLNSRKHSFISVVIPEINKLNDQELQKFQDEILRLWEIRYPINETLVNYDEVLPLLDEREFTQKLARYKHHPGQV